MSHGEYPAYRPSAIPSLGRLPAHWLEAPLKAEASWNDEVIGEDTSADQELLYADISSLDPKDGITSPVRIRFADAPSRARRIVRHGDVIISTVRTYLRAIATIKDASDGLVVSTGFAVIRSRGRLRPEFLGYLLSANYFMDEVVARSVGVSYPAINAIDLVSIKVPLPPVSDQVAIVRFLDQETGKVDALIAEQRRLLELLEEKRQAVIAHTVTKGLNAGAPRKPSDIEWTGALPAHWDTVPLARLSVSWCDGPFGSGLKSDHYSETGIRVVRLQNIRQGDFNDDDSAFIETKYYEHNLRGHEVRANDVLIAGLGDDRNIVGRACAAPANIEPAMVKADCFRFRINEQLALPAFVVYALNAGAAHAAGFMASGSTRARIPLSRMGTRKLPVPPLEEQAEITAFLDAELTRLDKLRSGVREVITLLTERRSALISAAVTGQIDVRSVAAAEAA